MRTITKKSRPLIIGLTGGIAMGKSTAARILAGFGLAVHDADKSVHRLIGKGGKAVKPVAKIFPESLKAGAIDRKKLGALVFHQPKKLKQLEKILHPLVRREEENFIRRAAAAGIKAVVLDIPLLFETGGQKRCTFTICVTAPPAVQQQRVLRRKGMTPSTFKAIVARQMKDSARRKRADYVVGTGLDRATTKRQLESILRRHNLLNDKPVHKKSPAKGRRR